ncbi:Phosphatidylinositide phosphatase SAC2 [Tolypocladium ophioglossoides CBS 100239]|uniref:Phosphatidylinositide phosphatase SAC2 n=1 Tax=Tolypocladium ophioglossoides (strain CBS 100239) TaxID=1163406 RepID=A0A0L0MY26_TOLOC|nr:Phosphatidylinositide phosphatase SAC2 [Tolypocladium ophioglossoides CBS 100239]
MPGIARKIVICAAIDGLIIQPLSPKGQRPLQPVRVRYGDSSISAVPRDQLPDTSTPESSFEAFGILGLITVSRLSYLVSITRRQQVAQIFGFPIYVVTEVAVTPCTSKADADKSIRRTAGHLRRQSAHALSDDGESSDEETELSIAALDEVEDAVMEEGDSRHDSNSNRSSVAEDVIRRRGSYGRFAQSWFSRSGWTMDQRRTMGMSISSAGSTAGVDVDSAASSVAKVPLTDDADTQTPVSTLLPKLLRTVKVLFGSSRSFYFSYDLDITRSLSQDAILPRPDVPLHAQVDSAFFWNRHILQQFMATGQESLALPVMQGFVGQRTFVVDSQPPQQDEPSAESVEMSSLTAPGSLPGSPPPGRVRDSIDLRPSEKKCLITLISRRSNKRAGLRYLRRGVNEDGFTANMVETEQIISSPTWDKSSPTHSFLQIRGSIPLFFTQSAYSLKPVPVIQHSPESNYKACKRHFERLSRHYGELQIVNLVEEHGVEESIGTQYQKNVERLNEEASGGDQIPFEWFDFHQACRGMKFENVSHLLLRMKDRLEELGSSIQEEGELIRKQKGVLRTNCMDCLDRTNVCQSSFAKHMLELQLKEDGIDMSAQLDQETMWFNTLWADNGDAVSKQYASTAAMKGDYTRTRKRDYRGALNDLGLSLARFYSGMVNDYFSQAAIDFLLGNVTAKVFDEFESDMMTKDPAVSISKMRERAVELCQKRVVADVSEEVHGGWVLISPNTANVVKSWPMEEVVLLLTNAALYLCRFDWDLDKVSSFERVHLGNVTHIKFGTYITSTIAPSHMDEMRNVGFVVEYQPGKSNVRRTNTRTLSTRGEIASKLGSQSSDSAKQQSAFVNFFSGKAKSPAIRKLAFKAPYTDSSVAVSGAGPRQTEIQQVVTICAEVERLALERQLHKDGEEARSIIDRGDIISLEAAKKNTGLLEQLGHSIKKLVWG